MIFKFPKDDKKTHWTRHIKDKMFFYGISEQKIRTILKNPARREEGIAPDTIAVMKRNDTAKRKQEIWIMYKMKNTKTTMISAWRYPGTTKAGERVPIPEDIIEALGHKTS